MASPLPITGQMFRLPPLRLRPRFLSRARSGARSTTPPRVRAFIAGVLALAALAVAQLTLVAEGAIFTRPWLLSVCVILFALQGLRAIRRRIGSEGEAEAHEEALFVFVALLLPPEPALATFALGTVVGQLTDWRGSVKAAFNVAQFVGSAAVGLTVVAVAAPDATVDAVRVTAVLCGVAVFLFANRAAVAGVLAVIGAARFWDAFRSELRPDALIWTGTVSVGALAGIAASTHAWAFPFAVGALVALLFAFSGHARARHDRQALDEIVDSSPAGIVSVDANGVVRAWNREMERITERLAVDAEGRDLRTLLTVADAERGIADLLAESGSHEARLVRFDAPGGVRWLMLSRASMPDGGWAFVAQDVTEKRDAERVARENADRFRFALDAGGMGWWDWDMDSGEIRWSENLERISGLEPGTFGGTIDDFLSVIHPDDRAGMAELVARPPDAEWQETVYRGVWPDGTVRWFEDKGRVVTDAEGRIRGMSGVSCDVTDRKRAELLGGLQTRALASVAAGKPLAEVLEELVGLVESTSEDRVLASLLLVGGDGLLHDQAGQSLPQAYRSAIEGVPVAEGFGSCGTAAARREQVVVTDIAADPLWDSFRETALAHGLRACWSIPIISAEGEVLGTFALYHREAKAPSAHALELGTVAAHIAAVAIERTVQQERLASAEERYRRLVERLPLIVYSFAPDGGETSSVGRLEYVSPQIEDVLGYSPQEWSADPMRYVDALHPDDRGRVLAEIARSRMAGDEFRSEYRMIAKDGRAVWVHDACVYVRDETGAVVRSEGYFADVSDLKTLETELLQAQKLDAVGQLAGGIAHDFNNMMTGVIGFAEMALAEVAEDTETHEHLVEVRRAGERAAEMTQQLLAFSRKQVLQPRVIDVNAVVIDAEKLLRRLIGADVSLVSVLDATLEPVVADPGQLHQVLVNLAVNARDAMPVGGKLTIETTNVDLTEEYAALHADVTPGRYVQLAVTDTGVGMDERTRARIFEPFFTTKERGRGTGLGLATVFGIVKQSGGHLSVYSEPGHHTTFKIYLPCSPGVPTSFEPPKFLPEDVRGDETVLLVEDEELVRNLVRRVLERQGYVVLEAPSGARALDLVRDHIGAIDLLLTDVVMPEMSGPELARRLVEQRPGMKVLYASGYAEEAVVRHGVLDGGSAFLAKPVTPTSIALKVREVLASGEPAAAARQALSGRR